ncbi:restriction endonuclease type II-like protein [Piptocephalis cylindrospora]|uniref:Restriction endonuclease type II-like protein n=1 Tax=Piptocephalis cylindrospora TaxID=1907219 RepID=A0A4P9XYG1_9FUNG|nr:restriction endonuclease type II-like protein [Piptocephalis cylindrospora]|eukprot:RKP11404.1 restriction endonuclease type II-like protein [Piptocephalis cylindrospora]
MRIYFLTHAESIEEQQYLGSVRREKEAFERLIQESSVMSIPLDVVTRKGPPGADDEDVNANTQYLRTFSSRIAGGGSRSVVRKENKVIVDMREFRSSLPGILHAQSFVVIPCTLEIGDYILSPEVCVERKSIADLIQSFSSGRLFNQVEKMLSSYKTPVLLIEFDEAKAFSLQASGSR